MLSTNCPSDGTSWPRVILHADLNGFYAGVECLYRPDLRQKPVAVSGDAENRHGIILAKNEIAKRFSIKTGEAIWQARQKCPDLVVLTADYAKYLRYARLTRQILADFSDQVEPFGLDEAWIDVSGSIRLLGDGVALADQVRRRTREELGLTCSVGVSYNKIFAKLGSDLKKPDATVVISPDRYQSVVWPLPVQDLLYVGPSTMRRLQRIGIRTIGALAALRLEDARYLLGKWGETLWLFARGLDDSPVHTSDAREIVKSVGNSTTTPRDLASGDDVRVILTVLSESVAARLREYGLRCQTVQISIRDNQLATIERQQKMLQATDLARDIVRQAWQLFDRHWTWARPIRSLGVRGCDLVTANRLEQLALFEDPGAYGRQKELEKTIDEIRRRFGYFSIQRGLMLSDRKLSGFNPKEEHVIHPVSFPGLSG
ncbi:MAG: DNA polymerase IV [Clostridiaceae bacterium]|jgi:DNA polymerase-4|nr:DNA polymerase IV [Eubacteriales bacterium]MDD4140596.1 DNA polymerase IV [Eubacteriales bacterium]NLB43564.1 DNA polymerase IV [Clostridiaceae bacterium]